MKYLLIGCLFLSTSSFAQSELFNNIYKENYKFEMKHLETQETEAKEGLTEAKEAHQKATVENASDKLMAATELLVKANQKWANIEYQKKRLHEMEFFIDARVNVDAKIIDSHKQYLNCDSKTPEISLEDKVPYPGAPFQGAFFQVPHDNQQSFETCYANTAKNLLVGASGGKDVASFLDMALMAKDNQGMLSRGIAGGESCSVIRIINEKGFCPQNYSPIETGEINTYTQSLLGLNEGSLKKNTDMVYLLQEFLKGEGKLIKNNPLIAEQVLSKVKVIINALKENPNVKIPLPVVRSQIPGQWKIKDLVYRKKVNNDFLLEFKNSYSSFYPKYIRAVIEGKDRNQIFEIYQESMKPLITKYQIEDQMDLWKMSFFEDTQLDWTSPHLKKDLAESVKFLNSITGIEISGKDVDIDFCNAALGDTLPSLEFLKTLQPIIKNLKEQNVDSDIMLDEKGGLKSPTELMQLVVAPSCLNLENRKPIKNKIMCDDGVSTVNRIRELAKDPEEKTTLMRKKVLANLLQGYPVGNSIQGHINTIVGFRFNRESKECEIKIRESQDGKSSWVSEHKIYQDMKGLVEARPEKMP